ncbi:hypothetical protein KUTeg_019367, partial [Tegillarca granosa]
GTSFEEIRDIAKDIQRRIHCQPKLAIVCGSGMGALSEMVEDRTEIKYTDIHGFPVTTVQGHSGKLVFGKLCGKDVMLMQGRVHAYEGYNIQKITLPVRVMKFLGIETIFLTNAAGGLNEKYNVGDIMILKDHLNLPGFAGLNPLVGPNDERFGPRFPAMSSAYDLKLRQLAKSVAADLGFESFVHEGVYSMQVGPMFETVTECRFLRMIGADCTGMSTVPEVLTAIHCGMRVFALSLVTNCCVMEYDSTECANHEEVLETGKRRSADLRRMVSEMKMLFILNIR